MTLHIFLLKVKWRCLSFILFTNSTFFLFILSMIYPIFYVSYLLFVLFVYIICVSSLSFVASFISYPSYIIKIFIKPKRFKECSHLSTTIFIFTSSLNFMLFVSFSYSEMLPHDKKRLFLVNTFVKNMDASVTTRT